MNIFERLSSSGYRDIRRDHDVLLEEEEEEDEEQRNVEREELDGEGEGILEEDDRDLDEEIEEYREERNQRYHRRGQPMSSSVDYRSRNFGSNEFRRFDETSTRDGVRIRHQGDTTILTEHRDPYSFYWQLDQTRKPQEDIHKFVPFHSSLTFC
ncbi:unnamed protein product [Anisakis simplex]|uniref:Uncharacterized protein n=1 Tax=Anisakis simplex TaxID=6269 RepID=A0A0M3JG26_ANISI|nr:unnamed protein product [Anisakis simplex]